MQTSILKHMASLALASGAVLSPTHAQEAGEFPLQPDPAAVTAGFGLFEHAGVHTAHGPDYRALFGPRGMQFVPALGDRVVDEVFLGFELESIHLGDQALSFDRGAAPERDGARVVYPRGSVRERYEATAQGIELSFEFADLPQVDGDLIVRGRITGDLVAQSAGGERLEFLTPEGVGVYMGGVLGIDAHGATRKGSRNLFGQTLELRLPAEFVRGAAFPLVLDPLIGTAFDVGTARSATEIDISYDETTGYYAVVFERSFGLNSVHVYAQRVGTSGVLIGGPAPISSPDGTGSGINSDPCIANLQTNDRFVVAWQRTPNLAGIPEIRVTSASSLNLSLAPIVAVPKIGVESHTWPDIGGDYRFGGSTCMLVFVSQGRIQQARVTATTATTTVATPAPASVSGLEASRPAISRTCTPYSTYMLVYRSTTATGSTNARAQVLHLDGTWVAIQQINPGPGILQEIDVDGGRVGTSPTPRWQIVFDVEPLSPGGAEIGMVGVQVSATVESPLFISEVSPSIPFESNVVGDRSHPSVCLTGSRFHVAYSRQDPVTQLHRVQMVQMSAFTGLFALETPPPGTTTAPRQTALCGRVSGLASYTTSQDQALLAYRVDALAGSAGGGVAAQLFESFGGPGTVETYLAGCPDAGTLAVNALPIVGAFGFQFQLSNAEPATHLTALNLVVGTPLIFPCGSCALLVPQLLTYASAVGGTAALTFDFPYQPTWIGLSFYAQFLRLGLGSSGCPETGGLGGSNALKLTLGG